MTSVARVGTATGHLRVGGMTSRERMLAAIRSDEPDHAPCAFMIFGALLGRCGTYEEFVERQLQMGLDAFVELPPRPPVVVNDWYNLHGIPVAYDPRVTVSEWVGPIAGEAEPILVKEYRTPGGTLRTEVRRTSDWRWGDHVPFLDDYLEPRSRKFLVTGPRDIDALRYLLVPPTEAHREAFRRECAPALELARSRELLVAGGWGVGADLLGWVFGLENMMFASYDDPQFLAELLDLVGTWNRARMSLVLEAGIDLFIKRAWYENLDFWTPSTWRTHLMPLLRQEADLAHSHGSKLGYLITANCMPLLPMIAEAGVDVLIGVDPREWDIVETKRLLGDRVCLWGGVNGHLTVEQGSEDEVRNEVREAMRVLAPGGGFILSPVDNVRRDTEVARANVALLIDEWRRLTGQGTTGL
jgi:uroporphyrinogen-III decarboxylase